MSGADVPPRHLTNLHSHAASQPEKSASTDDKKDKRPTRKERHSTAPFPIQINQAEPMTKNPSVPSLPLLTIPAEATEAPALPVFLQVLLLPLFSRKKAPAHI